MFENGDYAEAATMFERADERGENGTADTAMYAIALSEIGRHTDAESVASGLLEDAGAHDFVSYAAGIVAFNAGDFATAATRFRAATRLQPRHERYRHALAVALVNEAARMHADGRRAAALASCREARDQDSSDPALLARLADLFGELGERGERRSVLEAWARSDPLDAQAWADLGGARRRAGHATGALEAYRNAVRLGTDEPEPYLAVARADGDVALVHLAIGRAIQKAGALELSAARELENEGGAIDEASLRRTSAHAHALSATRELLTDALRLLADMTSASALEDDLRMLAEWYPHSLELVSALARRYEQTRRFDSAETLWRDALADAPAFAEAHLGLGRCREAVGDFGAAATSYRRALALAPENRDVYAALRRLYGSHGRRHDLRTLLIDRTRVDTWNAVLLEELIALERELGLTSSAESRQDRLEKIRAESTR
jgi:tetratricopeptide (TPR) repeat protein